MLCLVGALIGIVCAQAQPARTLCIDGHVTKRPPGVTYQRCDETGEHGRCLAGPAKLKDDDEHMAGEKMCHDEVAAQKCRAAGEKVCPVVWTLDYAREWLAARWPVDAPHGY